MDRKARADAVKAAISQRWRGNGRKLEFVRNGRRLVFTSEPDYIRNNDGEIVGVDAWVRLYEADGTEIPVDPHRRIINPPTVPRSGVKVTKGRDGEISARTLTPKADEAFVEAVWDSVEQFPNPGGWNTPGTVTTIYSNTDDGRIQNTSTTYSSARAGTGTYNVNDTGSVSAVGQSFASPNYNVFQMFWHFDTSAIPDDAIVTSIDFELYLELDNTATDFTLEVRERSWTAPMSNSTFVPGASLASSGPIVAQKSTSTLPAVGNYWLLDTQAAMFDVANLKTGTVSLFGSSSRTRANNTPTGNESAQFSFAERSGTTQDPKLTIVHQSPTDSITEGFETNPLILKWTGTWGWWSSSAKSGSFSWKSPATPDNGTSATTLILPNGATSIQFWYRVVSEATFDFLRVYRDSTSNAPVLEDSGDTGWVQSPVIDVSSASTVIFRYEKDGSTAFSSDTALIDDVTVFFPVYSGGSDATVSHSTAGAGSPGPKNGASETVTHATAGSGSPGFSGGSAVTVTVAVAGAGSPGWSAGSSTTVTHSTAGDGKPGFSGGSDVTVTVTAVGAGEKGDVSGGSDAFVTVTAEGVGTFNISEGSSTTVTTAVTGSGVTAILGGSDAHVTVTAHGFGRRLTIDVTVEVGPTRVVDRVAVGETRLSTSVGGTRTAYDVGDNEVRERVNVGASTTRERVEIGTSRTSVQVGDSRPSITVEPSRIGRGV